MIDNLTTRQEYIDAWYAQEETRLDAERIIEQLRTNGMQDKDIVLLPIFATHLLAQAHSNWIGFDYHMKWGTFIYDDYMNQFKTKIQNKKFVDWIETT